MVNIDIVTPTSWRVFFTWVDVVKCFFFHHGKDLRSSKTIHNPGVFKAKEWNDPQRLSQSPDLNPIKHVVHRKTHKRVTTEDSCSKGLAKHHNGGILVFGDVHGFQTSGGCCLQRVLAKILKNKILLGLMFICQITFYPLKCGTFVYKYIQFLYIR